MRQSIRRRVPICFCVGGFIEKWYGTKCNDVFYGASDLLQKETRKVWDAIFVGRLENDTGFKSYLSAFAEISNRSPACRLLVVGDGSLLPWAKNFIEHHELKVEFTGQVQAVDKYLSRAKVAFVSGYQTIVEAAINKIPIIAFFDNPLKKDYLTMHPQADNMHIVSSQKGIVDSFFAPSQINLGEFRRWAGKQTWRKIATVYRQAYR